MIIPAVIWSIRTQKVVLPSTYRALNYSLRWLSINSNTWNVSLFRLCSSQPKTSTFIPSSEIQGGPSIGVGIGQSSINDRPAVPPRNYQNVPSTMPTTMNPYNRFSYPSQRYPFSGGYSYGYGSSLPWSYNATPYGGYGMNGYNNFNSSNESRYVISYPRYNLIFRCYSFNFTRTCRFIRAAEDSVRPTFQAIESLTRAINSVAFMMESTFGSLNMSFQAILSVIENFSHARTLLKQFITSIITLRIFHKSFLVIVNLLRKYRSHTLSACSNKLQKTSVVVCR